VSAGVAPALDVRDVRKRYGSVTALDSVTLSVPEGLRVALVGESGSGKTTLLRCFNRMVEPDEGRVHVRGRDAATVDAVALRRSMGYAQQDGGLIPHWTVLANAALVPRLRAQDAPLERARRALDLVGLPPGRFGDRYPGALSGGQRQRAALARALAHEPDILLLDEPFGALDAITRGELQEAFAALVERLRVSVVLVTHDLREAFRLAGRVVVMRAGRIEQEASPGALARSPATPYVARLLERAGVGA